MSIFETKDEVARNLAKESYSLTTALIRKLGGYTYGFDGKPSIPPPVKYTDFATLQAAAAKHLDLLNLKSEVDALREELAAMKLSILPACPKCGQKVKSTK